jgi:carboxyl-terminal processing protease
MGIMPDVEVKLDEEAYKKDRTDTQLNKALEILSE